MRRPEPSDFGLEVSDNLGIGAGCGLALALTLLVLVTSGAAAAFLFLFTGGFFAFGAGVVVTHLLTKVVIRLRPASEKRLVAYQEAVRNWEESERQEKERLHRLRVEACLTIEHWRSLTPRQFEQEVAELLRTQGYEVQLTPASRDGGVDVKGKLGGARVAVQCKHQAKPTGVRVARELFGVMKAERYQRGIIVCSGGFSEGCRRFATGKSIELWGLHNLVSDRIHAASIAAPSAQATIQASPIALDMSVSGGVEANGPRNEALRNGPPPAGGVLPRPEAPPTQGAPASAVPWPVLGVLGVIVLLFVLFGLSMQKNRSSRREPEQQRPTTSLIAPADVPRPVATGSVALVNYSSRRIAGAIEVQVSYTNNGSLPVNNVGIKVRLYGPYNETIGSGSRNVSGRIMPGEVVKTSVLCASVHEPSALGFSFVWQDLNW
jgi:hypothetical protein